MATKAVTLVACAILSMSATVRADTITVQKPVPFANPDQVADKIKNECPIGNQVSDFVKQYAEADKLTVEFATGTLDTSHGKVLEMQIGDAESSGSAMAWGGHHKSLVVRGNYYVDGKKVASVIARRDSMGGMWGAYKSSCAVLGGTAKAVGRDIATWLKNPVDGARLGDL